MLLKTTRSPPNVVVRKEMAVGVRVARKGGSKSGVARSRHAIDLNRSSRPHRPPFLASPDHRPICLLPDASLDSLDDPSVLEPTLCDLHLVATATLGRPSTATAPLILFHPPTALLSSVLPLPTHGLSSEYPEPAASA